MEEDIDALKARFMKEARYLQYPSERSAIRDRYTDTSYYIFKTSQTSYRGSFLSFGSRRSSVMSSYGNTPTFIRRSFSSNGMLEYSVEQVGSRKFRDGHVLPFITKEEKETDDQEGPAEKSIIEGKSVSECQSEEVGALQSQGEEVVSSCKDDRIVDEDSHLSSKNHKIFHHYDMPPIRKQPLPLWQQRQPPEEVRKTIAVFNGSLIQKEGETATYPKCEEKEKINLKHPAPSDCGNTSPEALVPVMCLRTEPQPVHQKLELSLLPRLPDVSRLEESGAKLKSDPPNESSFRGDREGFSLLDSSRLERAASVNEKTTANSFPRKSANRFSLRDLPLRSPTPPKKSSRKTTKNINKEKEGVRGAASHGFQKGESPLLTAPPLRMAKSATTLSSLPPLITSCKPDSTGSGSIHPNEHPSLSLVDSKPYSVQSLDETPLFIVEEEDSDQPTAVSPRIGIHSLLSNGELSKSFIVVHPTNDSNSLGLAPLTSTAPTHKKRAPASSELRTTHSASTISDSGAANGPKSFLQYSNQGSSSNKARVERRMSGSEGNSHSDDTQKGTGGSFLSLKRPSQVRLLRFTKSSEEGNFTPFASHATKKSAILTNFQVSKAQIRSFPLDTSYEKGQSLDFAGDFVNTNSSRLCTVM